MDGFLGTGASFRSDITLVAYVLLILPAMLVGFVFARRKMFEPYHKFTMISIVVVNWILIAVVMAISFMGGVAPGIPAGLSDIRIWLPTLHLAIGFLAQVLGTYLVIRMVFEKQLPAALKVKNIKVYMRATLTGWFLAAAMGIGIYVVWYAMPSQAGGDIPLPAATDEPGDADTSQIIVDPEGTEAVAAPEVEETLPDPEGTEAVAAPEVEETLPEPDTTDEP